MNRIFLAIIILSLFLVSLGSHVSAQSEEKVVVLETNFGAIVIEFFSEDAPNHVDNFIGLTESGFYDGTIFHRIIPGFMIQGGDPNTISGDQNTWGTGGPGIFVDAEFNTIKHNRGIVSMARSPDPNSAGSQFFIVHKDSNFLDGQYTVFGRIITEESFLTLDKIAEVQTGNNDIPIDTEQVKITKATAVNRNEILNILDLSEPERMQSDDVVSSTGYQKFESPEHKITFSVPEGWLLQEPEKVSPDSPDVVAIGPKIGEMNPVISLVIQDTNNMTLDELITEKNEKLAQGIESGDLTNISQEKKTVNGNQAYLTNAEGIFSTNDEEFNVKFQELLIYDAEKFYTLLYSNGVDDFDSQLPKFEESINSFEISSHANSLDEEPIDDKLGGGCLIATAAYGSELAPQIQYLRELRDNTVLSTESGTAFMTGFNQLYYSFSPVIADLEREHPAFKEIVKFSITPMISTLSILNYVEIDSEQELLSYGLGIILMNIGMYFVAPTVVIYKIKNSI
ncbi:peptidylprolyl isomerase [Nitrosopumilus sp.]|uniref:peptidylprolyl isomerase n=1 Tax=Nitrosopumilus sp. TaxID=2024843 RepID=UPI00292F4DFB|nr:peptidylprolyl isomerase [Nitrosopumilus sp.]